MIERLYSVARWCYLRHIPLIPELIRKANFVLFAAVVPPECSIGPGTKLHHHGLCTIIHPDTEIGSDCNIYNQVVIGGAHDGPDGPSYPHHRRQSSEHLLRGKGALQSRNPENRRREHDCR